MRALQVESLDGPDGLRLVELEPPTSEDGVVIEVHAAGVSFPDLLMSRGEYQFDLEPPFVPGTEAAGVVLEAPPGSRWRPGDRVSAYTILGGYGEVVAAPEERVVPLAEELSFAEGAAMVINYQTAFFALRVRSTVNAGDTLVVHGAAGGVGIAAVQVGLAIGARVIGVVTGGRKAEVVERAGPVEIVDLEETDDWVAAVREMTGGAGADVVFDPVGGSRFERSLRAVHQGGKVLVIGFASGTIAQVPSNHLLLKNVDAVGVAWGMYLEKAPSLMQEIAEPLGAMVDQGLRPIVGRTFPFEEGAEAMRTLSSREAVGKTVLEVRG